MICIPDNTTMYSIAFIKCFLTPNILSKTACLTVETTHVKKIFSTRYSKPQVPNTTRWRYRQSATPPIYAEIQGQSASRRGRYHPGLIDLSTILSTHLAHKRCHSIMSRDQTVDDARNPNTRTMMTARTMVIPRIIIRLTGKTPLNKALWTVKYL